MVSKKGVAWYDVKGEGWLRDVVVLLHPPYTLWHLSYVPIGAALAPVMNWAVLGWTYLAFFLAMGVGGHCLDELNGRPLKTNWQTPYLVTTALVSIAGAIAIGVIIGVRESVWVIPCILFGGFIVFAYNMEWPRASWRSIMGVRFGPEGFFHRDAWFGIAWGAFPAITAYLAQTGTLNVDIVLLAFACWSYSMAQRKLSLQARFWRRKVVEISGVYRYRHKEHTQTSLFSNKEFIIGPYELSLKFLNVAIVVTAAGLLLMHLLKGGL